MDKDLLVIGGGINGVGVAADAAGRGLSVVLCEMGDLASATSSASSKLIHGGLRYLENAEFKLVRESLNERSTLMHLAPHLIKPQPFILPHCPWLRPYWLIRTGLFIYNFLAKHPEIPNSHGLSTLEIAGLGLENKYSKALRYYDCTEDDSRLVLHVAMLAKQHGAEILTRTKLVKARRNQDHWLVTLSNENDMQVYKVKTIVNAAGPWVHEVAKNILNVPLKQNIKWVKGSHIIVPRLFDHDNAFILQNHDNRVIFLIPYLKDFTLIGTTDILVDSLAQPPKCSAEEVDYLCNVTNNFIKHKITAKDIIYKYAGIRTLYDDHQNNVSKITRDYALELNDKNGALVISIIGGKITTYRSLAEQVGDKLCKYFPGCGKAWTKNAYLPGGYFLNNDFASFKKYVLSAYRQLPSRLVEHYVDNYGTRAAEILHDVQSLNDLGQYFGANLYQREVDYLVEYEWARTADDIMWRRGKMGMWLNNRQIEHLRSYLKPV